jgi:hypothetical protein
MGLFQRPKHDSGPYAHYLAPAADLNGGGGEYVFLPSWGLPETVYRGAGRLAGTFRAVTPPGIVIHPDGNPWNVFAGRGDTGTIYSQENNLILGPS